MKKLAGISHKAMTASILDHEMLIRKNIGETFGLVGVVRAFSIDILSLSEMVSRLGMSLKDLNWWLAAGTGSSGRGVSSQISSILSGKSLKLKRFLDLEEFLGILRAIECVKNWWKK